MEIGTNLDTESWSSSSVPAMLQSNLFHHIVEPDCCSCAGDKSLQDHRMDTMDSRNSTHSIRHPLTE